MKLVYIAWLAALILPAADVHAEKTEDLESFEPKYEQTGEAIADFSGEIDIAGAEVISGPLNDSSKTGPKILLLRPSPVAHRNWAGN